MVVNVLRCVSSRLGVGSSCLSRVLFAFAVFVMLPGLADAIDNCTDYNYGLQDYQWWLNCLQVKAQTWGPGATCTQVGPLCPMSCGLCAQEGYDFECSAEEMRDNRRSLLDVLQHLGLCLDCQADGFEGKEMVYVTKEPDAVLGLRGGSYTTLDSRDPCGSSGVSCDRCARVRAIMVGYPVPLDPVGYIPSSIFAPQFSQLEWLGVTVAHSDDTSDVPELPSDLWTQLPRLVTLWLTGNVHRGIMPKLQDVPRLQVLRFKSTGFSGDANLLFNPTMRSISARQEDPEFHNAQLSAAVCTMTRVMTLDLVSANLYGPLPDCDWSHFAELDGFYLTGNSLTGNIEHLFQPAELHIMQLGGNQFTGSLPPFLGSRTRLEQLDLSWNRLSGRLPDISGLSNLIALDLQGNQLTDMGALPGSLATVNVASNQLGSFPAAWHNLQGVKSLDISWNRISLWPAAGVYRRGTIGPDGSLNTCGIPPLQPHFNWPSLQSLTMAGNPLQGQDVRNVLGSLSYHPFLQSIDASNCSLSGDLPMENGGMLALVNPAGHCQLLESQPFPALVILALQFNYITGIHGQPWHMLQQVIMAQNNLSSIHVSWFSDGGPNLQAYRGNPDLHLPVLPYDPKRCVPGTNQLRGDPGTFSPELSPSPESSECMSLCVTSRVIGVDSTVNVSSLCRCRGGWHGTGTDCQPNGPDEWSYAGSSQPTSCPPHSSTLGQHHSDHPDACACDAGYIADYNATSISQVEKSCQACPENTAGERQLCRACASGTYSPRGSTTCLPCPLGSVPASAEPGFGCRDCEAGSYAQGANCVQCPEGSFQAYSRSTDCERCPPLHTTWERGNVSEFSAAQTTQHAYVPLYGASSAMSCGCIEGLRPDGEGSCISCGRGLRCPGGLGAYTVTVQEGYYADSEEGSLDLSVFTCWGDTDACRGGRPGSVCAPGREGISCSLCQDGLVPGANGSCVECEAVPAATLILIGLISLAALVVVYKAVDDGNVTAQRHLMLAVAISGTIFLAVAQHLGLVAELRLSWEEPLKTIFAMTRLLVLDMNMVPTGCITTLDAPSLLAARIGLIAIVLVCLCVVHIVNVCVNHRLHFSERQASLVGVIGLLASVFYMAIANTAIGPFRCLQHPNGQWTNAAYGSVICWTGEHTVLMGIASFALLLPIGYLAWLLIIFRQYPTRLRQSDLQFLHAHAFLHKRFRPGVYWWMLVPITRSLWCALALLVPDMATGLFLMQFVTLIGCFLTVRYLPWRVKEANFVDVTLNAGLVLLLGLAHSFIAEHAPDSDHEHKTSSAIALVLTVGLLSTVPVFVLRLCVDSCSKQSRRYEFFLCHHKVSAGAFAQLLRMTMLDVHSTRAVFLDTDNLNDLDQILYIVREESEALILVGSAEVFSAGCCVGEITAGFLGGLCQIIVELPGYNSGPAQSLIQELKGRIGIEELLEYGLTREVVQDALQRVHSSPTIKLPEQFNRQVLLDLERCLSARTVDAKIHFQRQSPQGCVSCIAADHINTEAGAAALILERILNMPRTEARSGYNCCSALAPHAVCIPSEVSQVILLCTTGCLESSLFLHVLIMLTEMNPQNRILPVIAQDSFRFPTKTCYLQLKGYVHKTQTGDADLVVSLLKTTFKEIPSLFQPQYASAAILQKQAESIAMCLSRRAGTTPRDAQKERPVSPNSAECLSPVLPPVQDARPPQEVGGTGAAGVDLRTSSRHTSGFPSNRSRSRGASKSDTSGRSFEDQAQSVVPADRPPQDILNFELQGLKADKDKAIMCVIPRSL